MRNDDNSRRDQREAREVIHSLQSADLHMAALILASLPSPTQEEINASLWR
jgi:hypothetical protein